MDGVHALGDSVDVVDNVTEVGSQGDLGGLVTEVTKLLVGGLEGSLDLGSEVEDENGLVNLDALGTSGLQLSEKVNVEGQEVVELVDGLDALVTVRLAEGEERDGTQDDGASDNAGLLGLEELSNRLGAGRQLENLVILQSRLNVVCARRVNM